MSTLCETFTDVRLITPRLYSDERGHFSETFRKTVWELPCDFVQDNESLSHQDVIRGMHFQKGQAKLVRCCKGKIYDVIVDIRKGSPTFGQWKGYVLSEENRVQLFIPDGFAHGFLVQSSSALVLYKVSAEYDPVLEKGFRYDDPTVQIEWPLKRAPCVSPRDQAAPFFRDIC